MRHPLIPVLLGMMLALSMGRESARWHVGPAQISDGDTLRIGKQGFRLKGVAAPERATEPGAAARNFVTAQFGGQWIACHETGQLSLSRYEAFCYTLTGEDIGAAVIRAGLACASAKAKYRVAGYDALERPDRPKDCGNGA
jgi:endonuclease YncB( thermonuclease family)